MAPGSFSGRPLVVTIDMAACLCIQQTWRVRVPTSLTLSGWDRIHWQRMARRAKGRLPGTASTRSPGPPCAVLGSTRPASLWPHPLPLTGRSLHPKTPRAELADLAHPLFVNCIGYSMSVMHKHWSGVGRRARLKVPFALKELTPCPHHHLMN